MGGTQVKKQKATLHTINQGKGIQIFLDIPEEVFLFNK